MINGAVGFIGPRRFCNFKFFSDGWDKVSDPDLYLFPLSRFTCVVSTRLIGNFLTEWNTIEVRGFYVVSCICLLRLVEALRQPSRLYSITTEIGCLSVISFFYTLEVACLFVNQIRQRLCVFVLSYVFHLLRIAFLNIGHFTVYFFVVSGPFNARVLLVLVQRHITAPKKERPYKRSNRMNDIPKPVSFPTIAFRKPVERGSRPTPFVLCSDRRTSKCASHWWWSSATPLCYRAPGKTQAKKVNSVHDRL